jgi:hypothetical protein
LAHAHPRPADGRSSQGRNRRHQGSSPAKVDNAERQIIKVAETENRIQGLQESFQESKGHDGTRAESFKRDMELSHTMAAAERKIAFGQMTDLIKAAGDKTGARLGRKFLMAAFNAENRGMTADIVREVFKNADGHTGNTIAKAAARAWLDTIEGLRDSLQCGRW